MDFDLSDDNVQKAFGLPEGVDPDHEYVYRSGEHGIYEFWYKDRMGNYWQYTNAPKDSPDYDPYSGEAMLVADQPMPHTAPQFYSEQGRKLHIAVPPEVEKTVNETYDPLNPRSVWYALYQKEGDVRYVYFDADIKENLDLWVQYQLRVTDAHLVPYRKYAAQLFESPHHKDQTIGLILMLADQCCFEAWELVNARVSDVEYVDNVVILLGRKIVCDPAILDYFSLATTGRDPEEPLFVLRTVHGVNSIGPRHIYSVFKALRVSPHFLLYWHATHQFSRIMTRLSMQAVPPNEIEERAMSELGRALNLAEDPVFLVDFKTKELLLENYKSIANTEEEEVEDEVAASPETDSEEVSKALVRTSSDDLGVSTLWSDLTSRRPDEQEFSTWLHSAPLHDTTPEEVAMDQEVLEQELEDKKQAEEAPNESDEGAVASADDTQGVADAV